MTQTSNNTVKIVWRGADRFDIHIRRHAIRVDQPTDFGGSDTGPIPAELLVGSLAASGWYTAAITMKLLVEGELRPAGGILGLGFEEFRWPRPVRPGDELRVQSEILEVRPSKSRPGWGLIKVRNTTTNQAGDAVQVVVGNLMVPARNSGGA